MSESPGWPTIARRHRRLSKFLRYLEITFWVLPLPVVAAIILASTKPLPWLAVTIVAAAVIVGIVRAFRRQHAAFEEHFSRELRAHSGM